MAGSHISELDHARLVAVITNGRQKLGMPTFKAVLTSLPETYVDGGNTDVQDDNANGSVLWVSFNSRIYKFSSHH